MLRAVEPALPAHLAVTASYTESCRGAKLGLFVELARLPRQRNR